MGGLTGLAGIPGLLGGAVAGNAGSFGDDIKGCLSGVSLFSPALGRVSLQAGELEMGYRHFNLPQLDGEAAGPRDWFIIEGAEFNCAKANPDLLRDRFGECLAQKRRSQPVGEAGAGCIFKNPSEGPAGKLLDEAGFKGRARGGMSFSELHANFMVNDGSGTSAQAFELIDEAREAVRQAFGVRLELEVKVWP